MTAAVEGILMFSAALTAGVGVGALARNKGERMERMRRHEQAMDAQRRGEDAGYPEELESSRIMAYLASLTRRLYAGATESLDPRSRHQGKPSSRSARWFADHAVPAGCSGTISVQAFCEAQVRLAVVSVLAGALFGAILSPMLAMVLAVVGGVGGYLLPRRAVIRAVRNRAMGASLHLSEMLEIVALGLRSGLSFDRSFALYGQHFNNGFARSCTRAYRSWSFGLCTRDEALHAFAASYDCEQLSRVVDSMIRSLRFGSPMAPVLEEASAQARAAYRAALEERVAKAPVKMMMPTGTLILPAMLLLVLGPVLLELANGF